MASDRCWDVTVKILCLCTDMHSGGWQVRLFQGQYWLLEVVETSVWDWYSFAVKNKTCCVKTSSNQRWNEPKYNLVFTVYLQFSGIWVFPFSAIPPLLSSPLLSSPLSKHIEEQTFLTWSVSARALLLTDPGLWRAAHNRRPHWLLCAGGSLHNPRNQAHCLATSRLLKGLVNGGGGLLEWRPVVPVERLGELS